VLLNASTMDICQKLYFANGVNQVDSERTLYVAPSIQGINALLLNQHNDESVLNLETLFNGTLGNPLVSSVMAGETRNPQKIDKILN
jgi:hypothetical protein